MRRFFLSTTTISLLAASAYGAEWAPPSTDYSKAPAGIYTLDKSHASIIFTINHLGFSNYTGRFNDFDATLDFNPEDVTKSALEVTINMDSSDTNHEVLENKLDSETFFNVAKFPLATFKATKIEKTSPTQGFITGDFTFMGVTKPVLLNTRFNGAGFNNYAGANVLGFSAVGALKRSDFGFTAYAPAIADEVKFTIEVEFNQPVEKAE